MKIFCGLMFAMLLVLFGTSFVSASCSGSWKCPSGPHYGNFMVRCSSPPSCCDAPSGTQTCYNCVGEACVTQTVACSGGSNSYNFIVRWNPSTSSCCRGGSLTQTGVNCGGHAVGSRTASCSNPCPPPCTPSCSGKSCGGNGCGGSCGSCSSGYSCSGGSCVLNIECGNGVTQTGETCDDGNTASGDGCSSTCQAEEEDIGLRMYDGASTVPIAIETTLTSPLRIAKDGTTYGIALVDLSDSSATNFRITTNSGTKAIKRLP